MANLSNVTYTANGATTIFVVPFSYIEEPDITVTVDGVTKTVTTDYTFNGSGDVVFNVAPLNSEVVYISRDSDVTQRVTTFSDGSELTEADLNNGGDQSLYLHQETRDLINTLNVDNASVLGRVIQNEVDIASNDTDIGTLVGGVAANAASIVTNASNIATNVTNIDAKVTGAASSTDNAVPKFDSTTGKIIQNTGVVISDTNEVSTTGDYVVFRGTTKEMELGEEVLESLSTGVTSPITLSINGGDPTKFDISTVDGHIVNRELDTYVTIAYAGSTGNVVSAANGVTYIFIDKLGAVVKQTAPPSPSDLREMIYLGRAIAIAGTLVQVLAEPIPIENVASALADLAKSLRVFNASGNIFSANGANLNIDKSQGFIYSYGSNYATDRNNPSLVTSAASVASSFAYITQAAGSTGSAVTVIDPTQYDLAGTVTAIAGAGKQATVQRVFLFPSGSIRIAYGQAVYSTLSEAVQGISSEAFIDNPNIFGNGILVGLLAMRKDATDLSNIDQARFLSSSRFGESAVGASGQSVSSLQDAYNNSSVGEVVLDSTLGALKVRDSGTPIGANLFEVSDSSGTTKSLEVKVGSVDVSSTLNMKEIATPSTPAAGYKSIYPKTDGKLYTLSDLGVETEVGSGGGGGGFDVFYAENFEDLITSSDFTTGNNATFDGGGTIAGTLSDDTTTEVNGVTSLKYVQASGSLNDWVMSPSIPVSLKQKGNTVGLEMYYTYDGNSDDIKIVGYDDTGSEVMTLASNLIKASSTAQRLSVQFPVPSTSSVINWGFQVVVENIGAVLVVDDVQISTNPFVSKDLLNITDPIIFTPPSSQGLGTLGTSNLKWSRDGAYMILTGEVVVGNITAVEAQIGLPNGEIIDNTLVTNTQHAGTFAWSGETPSNGGLVLITGGDSFINFSETGVFGAASNTPLIPALGNAVSGPSATVSINARIPIQGWTAATNHIIAYNSRNAENSMVRLHTGNGHGSTNTVIRRFSTLAEPIKGNAITYADSATDGASFTINEDGVYMISYAERNAGTANDAFFGISLNSSQLSTDFTTIASDVRLTIASVDNSNGGRQNCSWSGVLNKGDIIRPHTNASNLDNDDEVLFTISKIGVGDLLGTPIPRTAYIKDVKSSGTSGGTFTSGDWQTRDLNALSGDTEFVNLSANQFTLAAGKYEIEINAPAFAIYRHKAKLRNITDSTDSIIGLSAYADFPNSVSNSSVVKGVITLTSNKTFEVQHRCETLGGANGFGVAVSFGVDEIYTQVSIRKIS